MYIEVQKGKKKCTLKNPKVKGLLNVPLSKSIIEIIKISCTSLHVPGSIQVLNVLNFFLLAFISF